MLGKTTERKQKTSEPSEERKGELLELKKATEGKQLLGKKQNRYSKGDVTQPSDDEKLDVWTVGESTQMRVCETTKTMKEGGPSYSLISSDYS